VAGTNVEDERLQRENVHKGVGLDVLELLTQAGQLDSLSQALCRRYEVGAWMGEDRSVAEGKG
jgi:hypothetical protein